LGREVASGVHFGKEIAYGVSVVADSKIRNEPAVKNLLKRIPNKVAISFSDEQLIALKVAIGSRNWEKHKVDFRGTFPIPFLKSKIYYVFLMGRNHRNLTRREQLISSFTIAIILTVLITLSVLGGLLLLYLVKSALGINLIEGFSFGIWDWFKGLWK
jgi:hypothetical protein